MSWAKNYFLTLLCWSLFTDVILKAVDPGKPHIIIILADDLGWNDVSFHGSSQIPTPNIDALAYNGLILNQHYVQSLCTPSRSALMTGKYPIHTGMQSGVIMEAEPRGLPLSEKLLPQYLKEAGYATYAIGKWHLGFFRAAYTPTARGFDSHFGYWQGFQDYYDHTCKATFDPFHGLDMRRNLAVDRESDGLYATELYTDEATRLIARHNKSRPMFMYLSHLAVHAANPYDPFQAPDEVVSKFTHIKDPERRTYAGVVSKLDESVGSVVAALRQHNMLENSIILFLADNGAPSFGVHSTKGSNYPLRGMKNTPWDGGMRGVAAIWSPWLSRTQAVSSELFHISDWLPTFCAAAGLEINDTSLDGVNQWHSLSKGEKTKRTEILLNIDHMDKPKRYYAALRVEDLKYLTGTDNRGESDEWYGENDNSTQKYSAQSVLLSKAGVTFSALTTRLQIKNDRLGDKRNRTIDTLTRILSEEKILKLREAATIRCNYDNSGTPCNPTESPCVFNITDDPCEQNNLAAQSNLRVQLEDKLSFYRSGYVPPSNLPIDARADPVKWNNTWVPWYDELDRLKEIEDAKFHPLISPTAVIYSLVILALIVAASAIVIKQCVFNNKKEDVGDLPEAHRVENFSQQGNISQEQHCFDNVACTGQD